MKKIIPFLVVLLSFTSCQSQESNKQFSKKALKGKLSDVNQKEITLQEVLNKYKGKTVVLELWASWCGDCVGAMPKVKAMQKDNPNVTYVFISLDKTYDKWQKGIEKYNVSGENYWINDPDGMKGSFGKSINLDWIPRYIIIDKTGKVVTYRAIETDFDQINQTLKTLENEK